MALKVISCLTRGRVSGVDVFTAHLTRALRALGHDARILLTEIDEDIPDPMPPPADVPVDILPVAPGDSGRKRRRLLFSYLEEQAPCFYLPNYDYRHSIVSARVSDRVKVVGIVHSDDPMHYDHLYRLGKYWNGVVAVSDKIARKSAELDKSAAQRVVTIPYGIEAPPSARCHRREPGGPLNLLYAGRLEHTQKRVLDLPRVLDGLVARGVPVRMTIVGSGAGRPDLEAAARGHLERGSLVIQDTVPNFQMAALYEAADAFVLTSAFEGLPLGLLEAMAHGCVPMVTAIDSGIPEVVRDGVNGLAAPVGDIDGFARRLAALERDPETHQRLAAAARATIVNGPFCIEKMANAYLALFERLEAEALRGQFRRPRAFYGEPWIRKTYLRIDRNVRRLARRLRVGLPVPPVGAAGAGREHAAEPVRRTALSTPSAPASAPVRSPMRES